MKLTGSLALVIPCMIPPDDLESQIFEHIKYLQDSFPDIQFKLVLVHDHPVQLNGSLVASLKESDIDISILENGINLGKGESIRRGVNSTNADYYVFTDDDFPYDKESSKQLISKLSEFDVVIGKRDSQYFNSIQVNRRLVSYCLILMNKYLFGLLTPDTQCGLKGFNATTKKLFLSTKQTGFLFDVEFVRLFQKLSEFSLSTSAVSLRKDVVLSKIRITNLIAELINYLNIWRR